MVVSCAALFAFILEYQKLISRKEHKTTPSQPQKTNNKLSENQMFKKTSNKHKTII